MMTGARTACDLQSGDHVADAARHSGARTLDQTHTRTGQGSNRTADLVRATAVAGPDDVAATPWLDPPADVPTGPTTLQEETDHHE